MPLRRQLFLDNNKLEELPADIGRLVNLERLAMAANRLEELPDSIGAAISQGVADGFCLRFFFLSLLRPLPFLFPFLSDGDERPDNNDNQQS